MGEAARKRRAALPGDVKGTYADKLTLDEIASNDMEMTLDAIKNANRYHFGHDAQKAVAFIRKCMDATFRRLGMTSPQPPPNCNTREAHARFAAKIDKEMHDKQVRIEHRNNYAGSDLWRCGLYIYKRDELVCFISDVLTRRVTKMNPLEMKVAGEEVGYMVITNAVLEETKRIFLMPGTSLAEMPAVGRA